MVSFSTLAVFALLVVASQARLVRYTVKYVGEVGGPSSFEGDERIRIPGTIIASAYYNGKKLIYSGHHDTAETLTGPQQFTVSLPADLTTVDAIGITYKPNRGKPNTNRPLRIRDLAVSTDKPKAQVRHFVHQGNADLHPSQELKYE